MGQLSLEPQAELVAWSSNSDGYHMAMPCRDRIAHCLTAALRRSGLAPSAINYYNAHGTRTVLNDLVETQVIM